MKLLLNEETNTNQDLWQSDAACRSVGNAAELFFSDRDEDMAKAKEICAKCAVIAPCLEGAIKRAEPCGVWGGQIFVNGQAVAFKRRRGRPSKTVDPAKKLPQVPIPKHLQKLIA